MSRPHLATPSALSALLPILDHPQMIRTSPHATKKKSFLLHCRVPTAARMTTASFLALSLGAAELAARPALCADPPTHDCCNSRFRTPGADPYAIGPAVFFSAIVGRNALTPCLCGCSRAMPQDARACSIKLLQYCKIKAQAPAVHA